MQEELIKISKAEPQYNRSHKLTKYTVEMYHEGFKEHKLLSAPTLEILQEKVNVEANRWLYKWEAKTKSEEASSILDNLASLLSNSLEKDYQFNWESLKESTKFAENQPLRPATPSHLSIPSEPDPESDKFIPKFNFLEKISGNRRLRKENYYKGIFFEDYNNWLNEKSRIEKLNENADAYYSEQLKKYNDDYADWEKRQDAFYIKQADHNLTIDNFHQAYLDCDLEAVEEYCRMILTNSANPFNFPQEFELEYILENKILLIEYELPSSECIPKLTEIRYIAAKHELNECYMSEKQWQTLFDETLYKITFRTLYELFLTDTADAFGTISFNGWVNEINKATGKKEHKCILSIQVRKGEFTSINLGNIELRTCFKKLKGVAASQLSSITAIKPILTINKEDKRFIEGYNVADTMDDSTNIAAMNWEDFEHLVREIFEKEFNENGGEVKVTRSSRDGGVDAIAFDPDPLRGGKIVIQAKRYTNTVGVSAVRDLFGTLINEGATRGILVTTSDYGPDAYEFAKNKPLVLLNGSNLLHLLGKHGYHAKIDLAEAKKTNENNK